MTIRRRLSERAVVKENKPAWTHLQQKKTNTKEDLARVMTKSRSKTQTVTNGYVSQKVRELSF